MGWIRLRKPNLSSDTSGIALFMVIAAVSMLSILVTEFTYVASVNSRMAYDGLDQLQAHYLAKSGLKLSLLRLKAYTQVKSLINTLAGGGGGGTPGTPAAPPSPGAKAGASSAVPQSILDKLWNFPFFYPIPTNIPGLSGPDKDKIKKFEEASNFNGRYSAVIESESSRININSILSQFSASPVPLTSGSPSPAATGGAPAAPPAPSGSPSASASFSPEEARKSLSDFLYQGLNNKMLTDPEFSNEYRDFKFDDFMDGLYAWIDHTYERKSNNSRDAVPIKQAPMYSVSELHQVPMMDDQLYSLWAPSLTVAATTGVNLNTMQENTVHALVPQMTADELTEFFKFRDAVDVDNTFKSADDFYTYLKTNIAFYKSEDAIDKLKTSLSQRNIQLVTEESQFKITVQAQVNQATRIIEAYVTLGASAASPSASPSAGASPSPKPSPPPAGGVPNAQDPNGTAAPDPGLRITFMRIL